MLEIKDIHVNYGAIQAIKGITITVNDGELVSLVGANGAGKTTILHTISGLLHATSGEILLDGKNLQNVPANTIINMGLAHVPEGRHIFSRMTVEENLRMGAYIISDAKRINDNMEKVFHHFPRLKERARQLGGTLSGGEQQMLAIGRALMANPKILLLDEPSLGLAPLIVRDIFEIVKQLNQQGVTIVLVEQNAKQSLKIANYAYVLEVGSVSMEGAAEELLRDERVIDAYLGKS